MSKQVINNKQHPPQKKKPKKIFIVLYNRFSLGFLLKPPHFIFNSKFRISWFFTKNSTDIWETSPFCMYIYEKFRVNSLKLRVNLRKFRIISRKLRISLRKFRVNSRKFRVISRKLRVYSHSFAFIRESNFFFSTKMSPIGFRKFWISRMFTEIKSMGISIFICKSFITFFSGLFFFNLGGGGLHIYLHAYYQVNIITVVCLVY